MNSETRNLSPLSLKSNEFYSKVNFVSHRSDLILEMSKEEVYSESHYKPKENPKTPYVRHLKKMIEMVPRGTIDAFCLFEEPETEIDALNLPSQRKSHLQLQRNLKAFKDDGYEADIAKLLELLEQRNLIAKKTH